MGPGSEYRLCREGDWSLLVYPEIWTRGLWEDILQHLNASRKAPTYHPQTINLQFPPTPGGRNFYLKIHDHSDPIGSIKDLFRESKAFRALKQGRALCSERFHTPISVAAGEKRRVRFVRQAFLLTLAEEGTLLPRFLQEHYADSLDPRSLKRKRKYLMQLASEVRRMHQKGFVPGDLVPYNVLVKHQREGIEFFYLDHDRTRRYPRWFPHGLWKRNLVQLNHFELAGISNWDRIRFLHFYLGSKCLGKRGRRLIRWLDKKTRIKFEMG